MGAPEHALCRLTLAALLKPIYPRLQAREGVNIIKKPDITGVKRVNINIPIGLHNSFKAAAASRGENMTDVLVEFIQAYVDKHSAAAAKKGRRA
jgi:hypothetical protein